MMRWKCRRTVLEAGPGSPAMTRPNPRQIIPDQLRDLLDRPLFADLATVREDGTPQVNPMWFAWDGELLRFTHTNFRRKYRNITANPAVAISIVDPRDPYRYIEVRGVV